MIPGAREAGRAAASSGRVALVRGHALLAAIFILWVPAPPAPWASPGAPRPWPEGTEALPFENLEGMVLLTATARGYGERDTTGLFILDTGAGSLALDSELARMLGVAGVASGDRAVRLADRPLPRFTIGAWSLDHLSPVLTIEADPLRRATDRPVLGLVGQGLLRDRVLWLDYHEQLVALIPASNDAPASQAVRRSRHALAGRLSPHAAAVPFRLAADGKVLVRAKVAGPTGKRAGVTLIVDTGSSKCVLFEEALGRWKGVADWPALRGLIAPTLLGTGTAWLTRVTLDLPAASVPVTRRGLDAAVVSSPLGPLLSRAVGESVDGLLGYSFLKRFNVAVDYPRRILWLDPLPDYRDDRPFEYSHVGLQIERRGGQATVAAVADRSPAALAGICPGDEIVLVDGASVDTMDTIRLARRMEGRPGSAIELRIRRGDTERTYHIRRRRLL